MDTARDRRAGLADGRGGRRLSAREQLDDWLERESNRDEWQRLRSALDFADGFVFLAVQIGDRLAADRLGGLLADYATAAHIELVASSLERHETVSELLEFLRTAPRPRVFWIWREDESVDLDQFLALLNQKRDVVAKIMDAPLVLAMHSLGWARFRANAPDFWSVHHSVFRFSPARRVVERREPSVLSLDHQRAVTRESHAHPRSGWRVSAEQLAVWAAAPRQGLESQSRWLQAMLSKPGARALVLGDSESRQCALLHEVVAEVADRHADGVWWVTVGRDEDPEQQAALILARLVGDLLPHTPLPVEFEVLRRVYVSATEHLAALFVFVGVESTELADWLLPGMTTSVVMTAPLFFASSLTRAFSTLVLHSEDEPSMARAEQAELIESQQSAASSDVAQREGLRHYELGQQAGRKDHDLALSEYRQALSEFEQAGDLGAQELTYFEMGQVALSRGDLGGAESWFRKALVLAEDLRDEVAIGANWWNLAHVAWERGEARAAFEMLAKAYANVGMIDWEHRELEWYQDAPDDLKPSLRQIWEDAGHVWSAESLDE